MAHHDRRGNNADATPAPRRRQLVHRAFATTVALLVASVSLGPAIVHAASYTVWACANGSGQPLGPGDWRGSRVGDAGRLIATCGTNSESYVGSLLADATTSSVGAPFATGNGWGVTATGGTKVTALTLWWAYQVNPVSVPPFGRIQIYADNGSPLVSDEPDFGTFAAGSPSIAFADANKQTYGGLAANALSMRAWCGNWCDRSSNVTTAVFEAYRLRATIDDSSPPTGVAAGLQDGARVVGPTPVAVRANDVGGGVRTASLRVDGRVVDSAGGGETCGDVDTTNADPLEYGLMRPCPGQRDAVLTLLPGQLADAEAHVVTVVATDAAGQDTVLAAARVARAAPPGFHASDVGFVNPDLNVAAPRAVNGANGGPARMYLAFVTKRKSGKRLTKHFKSRLTVKFGRRAMLRGRLVTAEGAPIVGARVWRAVEPVGQSVRQPWRLSGKPLITSKTGRVTGRMPVSGGNRNVQLVYFPYSDVNGHGATPTRALRVRAATTIGLDQYGYRNGETAHFTGRVRTRSGIARKAVYLQALIRGRWRTFDTTRADAKGRWRLRYRFTATRRLTVYHFRAVVPAEAGYPWVTGHSRVVRVIITP